VTKQEYLATLEAIARDETAAAGVRLDALQTYAREAGWLEPCPCRRRPWWVWLLPKEATT
jgi:hypothetical protein